ncbi:MAG: hypothetical protein JXD22_16270 [Sedimentisphaerales bacterium]|nr:hypothetical protein [Sedimentisphaerales bacterium]
MTRKRYRLISWLIIALLLLAGAGYALLPWLLPVGVIKDGLKKQLEADFGREVSVGQVKISWARGVEITDLRIGRKEQFGPGNLATIGRVTVPFVPGELIRGRIKEVLIEGAEFWVVHAQGKLNVQDLPPLDAEIVTLRQVVVHFAVGQQPTGQKNRQERDDLTERPELCELQATAAFTFDEIKLVLDKIGGMTWSVKGGQQGVEDSEIFGRGMIIGSGKAAEGFAPEKIATGGVESADLPQSEGDWCEFSTSNIQLAQLGMENWLRLVTDSSVDSSGSADDLETGLIAALEGLKSIEGGCSLAVKLQTDQFSGMIDVDYEGAVAGLKVIGSIEDEDERVLYDADELKIAAKVKFDPVSSSVEVGDFSFVGPGVFVAGAGDCAISKKALSKAVVRIAEGVIKPAEIIEALGLGREVEQQGIAAVGGKIEFSGVFSSDLSGEQRQNKVGLEINATDLELSGEKWDKSAGEILKVKLASDFDSSAELEIDASGVAFGGENWNKTAGEILTLKLASDFDRSVKLEIDASGVELSGEKWNKTAGEILKVKLASDFDRSAGLLRVDDFGWQCGAVQGASQLKAQLQNPEAPIEQLREEWESGDFEKLPERLSEIFKQVELVTKFKVADIKFLEDLSFGPVAEDSPAINLTAQGPMEGRLLAGFNQNQAKVECRLSFPSDSIFACRRGEQVWIEKQPGKQLSLTMTAEPNLMDRSVERFVLAGQLGQAEWSVGPGRLVWRDDFKGAESGLESGGAEDSQSQELLAKLAQGPIRFLQCPWRVTGLEQWASLSPELARELTGRGIELSGDTDGQVVFLGRDNGELKCTGQLDLTSSAIFIKGEKSAVVGENETSAEAVPAERVFAKSPDTLARLEFMLEKDPQENQFSCGFEGRLGQLSLRLAGEMPVDALDALSVDAADAENQLPGQWGNWYFELAAEELGEIEEFFPGILDEGHFVLGEDLRLGGIRGSAGLQGELSWDEAGENYNFKTTMDLSGAEFLVDSDSGDLSERLMHKPSGELLRVEGVLTGDNKSKTIRLKPFTLQAGRSSLQAGVLLKGVNLADLMDLTNPAKVKREDDSGEVDLDVTVDIPDVAGTIGWFEKLSDLEPAGRLRADGGLVLQLSEKPKVIWKPGQVDGAVSWTMKGEPAELELSHVEFSPGRLYVPAVTVRLGENRLSLVADVSRTVTSDQATAQTATGEQLPAQTADELQGFQGRVDVLADYLNLDDLKKYAQWLGMESTAVNFDDVVQAAEEATAAVASGDAATVEKVITEAITAEAMAAEGVTAEEGSAQDSGEKEQVHLERAGVLLRRCSVAGSCDIGQLCFTDPGTGAFMELQQLRGGYELAGGVFRSQISAGLGGGVVELAVNSVLEADEPVIEYHQSAREMSANESLKMMVESEFPGLEVTGTISEKKDMQVALGHVLAGGTNWQGTGVTKCRDGTLYGPGGPNWLMKVFPGLKLVEYKWREMTNQYECYADGSKKNHMLFDGQRYDIYITGLSQPMKQPEQYEAVMEKVRKDLLDSRERLASLNQGSLNLTEEKARRLRIQNRELEKLWLRHEAGEKMKVSEADYIVGALMSAKSVELFGKPREFLRVPIFYSHSFVVERAMVGIETSNVAVGTMKQIMKKVENNNVLNLLNGNDSD